ncbi:MAG: hypothetical protein LBQ79_03320 [Deltaproteobacteria bacterium]|jgi:hypothetical protein|nr:hypothetical protein [Deltaproteobacteria bacterium]
MFTVRTGQKVMFGFRQRFGAPTLGRLRATGMSGPKVGGGVVCPVMAIRILMPVRNSVGTLIFISVGARTFQEKIDEVSGTWGGGVREKVRGRSLAGL